jgi:ATP-dependent Clp protease ATP-binding subunit ClpC
MSECSQEQDVSKLTGAAPSYIGYDDGGRLTNLIKTNPSAVLCLDEIEKAHPKIFNTFLQVMEDGVLTSGQGETVSFSDILIIMTSNLGAKKYGNKIGFSTEKTHHDNSNARTTHFFQTLKKAFKPEFLGRLDGIIVFNELNEKEILTICTNILKQITLTADKLGIKLTFDNTAIKAIAKTGLDPEYGARPLRQVISKQITDVLSDKILADEIKHGDSICVKYNDKDFIFCKKKIKSAKISYAKLKGEN